MSTNVLSMKNKTKKHKTLSPQDKRKAILKICLLSILFVAFFFYNNYLEAEEERLLINNYGITTAKIIGTSLNKMNGNIFEYEVSETKHQKSDINVVQLITGEYYKIKYSKSHPDICEVIYTKPVIKIEEYIESTGVITNKNIETSPQRITFKYFVSDKKYVRQIYISNAIPYKIGNRYRIIINKTNNQISYLSDLLNPKNESP